MKVYKYRSYYDRDVISLFLNQLFAQTYNNLNDNFYTRLVAVFMQKPRDIDNLKIVTFALS